MRASESLQETRDAVLSVLGDHVELVRPLLSPSPWHPHSERRSWGSACRSSGRWPDERVRSLLSSKLFQRLAAGFECCSEEETIRPGSVAPTKHE